jgi:glucose-1-phosphate cytidylyltransferase
MKVALLAGGLGTRLAEETGYKPKPLVEIGKLPILWHIMMMYQHYGFRDFVIALGYKGDCIRQFFSAQSGFSGNASSGNGTMRCTVPLGATYGTVEMVDTGYATNTGGRIKRLAPFIHDETFMLTWSDGLANINLSDLLRFHRSHARLATVTAIHPPVPPGTLLIEDDGVAQVSAENQAHERWVNGAFFVLNSKVFDYIEGDNTQWEREPMTRLAADGQLMAYRHESFWQCMDTPRDKQLLESLWLAGRAPWKVWE